VVYRRRSSEELAGYRGIRCLVRCRDSGS
ncbi:DMSO reductase anchor subunit family protein, partial [Vibrio parahaemolyticus VP-48]